MKALAAIVLVSCLTIFAIYGADAFAGNSTATGKDTEAPVEWNFKLGSENTFVTGSAVNASFGTSVDYQFFKSYSIGAEYSLYAPYTQFDDYVFNGSSDASFYLADNKLWTNKYYGLNLSATASITLPVSHWSQEASINWIAGQVLVLKKTFTDREWISWRLSANEYSVNYVEAYIDDETGDVDYNTRYDINNRLTYSVAPFRSLRGLHFLLGGGIRMYNNYHDSTYYIYRLGAGTSIDITKSATFDFAVTSFMKDSTADSTWNGPATSDHFFDAKGTLLYLSFSMKI